MKSFKEIHEIMSHFCIDDKVEGYKENNTGIINSTYVINCKNKKYILQKINTEVFKNPSELMQNIYNVTEYYKEHSKGKKTLNVIKNKNGELFYRTPNNEYYRVYDYINNAVTYNSVDSSEMFSKVGKAFGNFAMILNDYPIDNLYETIPNFHNTVKRYEKLLQSIKNDKFNRVKNVKDEINFVMNRVNDITRINRLMEDGSIPLRVTHNDTKINNVLMDKNTGEDVCVIDMDTVMPGSILFDFGDAIRSGASYIVEDSTEYDKVGINMEYFESFTESFLNETKDILTEEEINNLAFSCRLMTLELIIRFLDDYINGDVYFRCDYDTHNLVRTKNQIKLLSDMEKHYEEMVDIVNKKIKNDNVLRLKK